MGPQARRRLEAPGAFRYPDGQVTQTPGERTFFQSYALREVEDVKGSLGLEVRKGDTVKRRLPVRGRLRLVRLHESMDLTAPVVFVGYGIREGKIGWDELKGLDLKGKIVLVLSEAPGKDDPKSPFQAKEIKDKYFPPTTPAVYHPGGPDPLQQADRADQAGAGRHPAGLEHGPGRRDLQGLGCRERPAGEHGAAVPQGLQPAG